MTATHRRCTLATMKNLGERIRELRDEKDLSMRELAKRAEISSAYLSDIEFDKRHPSDDVMHRLADALDTTFKELKEYDTRKAVEEMKQRVSKDPRLGFALRRVLDENVTAEELVKLANDKAKRAKK